MLLEFASKPEHLTHIFGETDDPLRDARIAGMNMGNALDYPFMLAYGLFILSFFACVARQLPGGLWLIFGWLCKNAWVIMGSMKVIVPSQTP